MATDPQSLFTASPCYSCYTPGEISIMEVALLAQISLAKNPANAVDPKSLLAAAQCYACYMTNPAMLQLMKLALLAQIAP